MRPETLQLFRQTGRCPVQCLASPLYQRPSLSFLFITSFCTRLDNSSASNYQCPHADAHYPHLCHAANSTAFVGHNTGGISENQHQLKQKTTTCTPFYDLPPTIIHHIIYTIIPIKDYQTRASPPEAQRGSVMSYRSTHVSGSSLQLYTGKKRLFCDRFIRAKSRWSFWSLASVVSTI